MVHDIEGTKPVDIACCIIQMRQNKLGRLRKFHDDGLLIPKKFQKFQATIYFGNGRAIDVFYARVWDWISSVCISSQSVCQSNGQDEDGDNGIEISTVEAEEKWSKRTRERHSPATFAGKYQQAPKKQLINTMWVSCNDKVSLRCELRLKFCVLLATA